ncbi:DUF5304 family protein [Streptomyces sp. NPDC005955]|uniref:DUF5304 domain-containing protein n=1 Tax=Streptomyces sp. NPDC005955 TaxID=3364738 RepID=UPI0036B86C94
MSDAERPAPSSSPGAEGGSGGKDQRGAAPSDPGFDTDAWSTACAEDLAEEQARRRAQYGPPPGSATEELRKLMDAVADKLSGLSGPLLGPATSGVVQQVVRQAREAVEPVIERNPAVFDHLTAAGGELLAAYRSAVQNQESRWTRGPAEDPRKSTDGAASHDPDAPADPGDQPGDEGTSGGGRIDLD